MRRVEVNPCWMSTNFAYPQDFFLSSGKSEVIAALTALSVTIIVSVFVIIYLYSSRFRANFKIVPLTNVSCVLMFPHRLQRWRRGTQPHNWPCSVLSALKMPH